MHAPRLRQKSAIAVAISIFIAAVPDSGLSASISTPKGHEIAVASPHASSRSLVQIIYSFVADSGGGKPSKGAQILLGFEPGASAYIYAVDDSQYPPATLAYHGTWQYVRGNLTLDFPPADVAVHATFPLSLSARSVTMPFQLLSSKAGSSAWRMLTFNAIQAVSADYDAAIADSGLGLSPSQALARAFAYSKSWIGRPLDPSSKTSRSSPAGPAHARYVNTTGNIRPHTSCSTSRSDIINGTQALLSGITIKYGCDQSIEDLLQDFIAAGPQSPLGTNALASDPRVHLDPAPPGNGVSDPTSKMALIVAPFTYTGLSNSPLVYYRHGNIVTSKYLDTMHQLLRDAGYQVAILTNNDATVAKVYQRLKDLHPGVLLWFGHGDVDGGLGVYDGRTPQGVPACGPVTATGAPRALYRQAYLACVGIEGTPDDPSTTFSTYSVTPQFWITLRHDGIAFHRSLVFIGACVTDIAATSKVRRINQKRPIPQKPGALARAFAAGAYFAWSGTVSAQLNAAVAEYLITALSRPTHTAEETFYNLLRVAYSGQMIYKEDTLLNSAVHSPSSGDLEDSGDLYDMLDAYGYNGRNPVSYWGNGWDSGTGTWREQIWWLIFAARWSHDINVGVTNLESCEQYWNANQLPGLKSVFCQNANAGSPPTKQEVAYAQYVLTGKPVPPGAIPRWTLDDGK